MHHRFRRTTVVLVGCLACLVGLGMAAGGWRADATIWLACLPLLPGIGRRSLWVLLAVICFGFELGVWRGSIFEAKLTAYQPYFHQNITAEVTALDDATYGQNSQLAFDANNIQLSNGERLAGKLEISGFGADAIFQGDTLKVNGSLYPALGAYQGRISFAKLQIISHHPSLLADLRRRFSAGMQTALPEPLAPFAMGLLIGQRATLPANVKQDLLEVGLTHIIAVSGYNLTIMLNASKKLLGGRSKRLSTGLSLGLMVLFVLLAGVSASIVRAAIVSTLSIAANYYGRTFKPFNLIALAAAVTAWANPFYLWSDTSWYLSFLAFYGVMVVSPLLGRHLPERWRESVPAAVALESISAEIMTLPFVLYTFGQMSFIGLPANVLVVSLVPLAMLLSLIAGLAGMFAGPAAGWLAWPAHVLLNYMLDISHLLSHVPHIFLQNLGLSLAQMIGLYFLVLLATIVILLKTNRAKYATITDKDY